jgi:hypothetical protein
MALFLGLIISVVSLIYLRNALNRYLYQFLLQAIGNKRVATLVFALLFFPGVALHEFSHWMMAKVLFVKTHRFSLIPSWEQGGTVRFGYVEMSKTDKIRAALIGIAPILLGIVSIFIIGFNHLHLEKVVEGLIVFDLDTSLEGIKRFFNTPDVLLWSYLLVAISNTMLPSTSDREAWMPAMLLFSVLYLGLLVILLNTPTGDWMIAFIEQIATTLFKAFTLAAVFNIILLLPFWLIDLGLRKARV